MPDKYLEAWDQLTSQVGFMDGYTSDVQELNIPTDTELIEEKYCQWGEHPDYPVGDWAYLVANGDTRLGYWEHVTSELEAADVGM